MDRSISKDTIYSQLDEIDAILTENTSITTVRIGLDVLSTMWGIASATEHTEEFSPLDDDDPITFPNVRSLSIPAHYEHSSSDEKSHIIMTSLFLQRIHKWQSVKELHLQGLHSTYTLHKLRGRLPNLKRLVKRFPAETDMTDDRRKELSRFTADFIAKAESLTDLSLKDMAHGEADVLWPAILSKKEQLLSLDLHTAPDFYRNVPVYSPEQVSEV